MPLFEVIKKEGHARRGKLLLQHGIVETPVFMPVGTYGAVKTMLPQELADLGTQILLGNTYHLSLRPGTDILKKFSGLHLFMNWDKPILTDSGGFQIFSLNSISKVEENGVTFRSHLNGDLIFLSPEKSAEIQQAIGSDIAMVLDELVALPNQSAVLNEAVEKSARWLQRFIQYHQENPHPYQKIFGIVQGGTDAKLRQKSLALTIQEKIDGLAIGGLSVGEPHEAMVETLVNLAPRLPESLPHYLMGVGTPLDILEAVHNGIDMFDCVLPTRNGRNGSLFTSDGTINIRNSQFSGKEEPLDPSCGCVLCKNFSVGYLHHLFRIQEILGCRLATQHNVYYYHRFMHDIRKALEESRFEAYYQAMRTRLRNAYL